MGHMTNKIISFILAVIIMSLSILSMSSCGKNKEGPKGEDGKDGVDGITPIIGRNGNWWLGDQDTGIAAVGKDGTDGRDGKDAIGPKLRYENGGIYVSYDNEESWELLIEINSLIENGKDGKDGADGVSITSCEINDKGEFVIHYSTGESNNLGKISGADGTSGSDGAIGKDCVSVSKCEINASGELVVVYSDGSSENLGKVVGTNGTNGTNGANGTDGTNGKDGENGTDGITPQLKIDTDTYQWRVSYDDGETWKDLGVVAIGANGQEGVTPRIKIDSVTNMWMVSYDDGKRWESLSVVATGPAGNDGKATLVKIGEDGYWYTSNDNGINWIQSDVKAQGSDGENGKNGNDGRGIALMEIIDGYLWVTYTDNSAPVKIGQVSSSGGGSEPGSGAASSEPYTDGLAFYPIGDGSEYGVSVGNALYMETIVIPSTYKGKPVTTILPGAFASTEGDNVTLKNVVVPNSIVKIGDNAFSCCVAMSNLVIPSSVKEIGYGAFNQVPCVTFEMSESEVPKGQTWTVDMLMCQEIKWKK